MSAPVLDLGDGLSVHPDLLLARGFIAGAPGTGKSSTGVVLLEEADRLGVNSAVVAITDDWWGIGSSADGDEPGLDHVQFGGDHGDLPLRADMGAALARMVADGMRALLVVSQMPLDERAEFVADFLEALLTHNRAPLFLLVDEAHLLAPRGAVGKSEQRARCRDQIIAVAATGRKPAKIGQFVITQRPSRLHTDVRELSDASIVHKVRGQNDRQAARAWVEDYLEDPDEFARIGSLDRGEAFVVAPDHEVAGVHRIRPKRTYDSSASGSWDDGDARPEPRGRSHVDLSAIEAQLGQAIEEARDDDPEALRERIAQLEADLAGGTEAQSSASSSEVRALRLERDAARTELGRIAKLLGVDPCDDKVVLREVARRFGLLDAARTGIDDLRATAGPIAEQVRQLVDQVADLRDRLDDRSARHPGPEPTSTERPPDASDAPGLEPARPDRAPDALVADALTGPQQRVLDALAWLAALGLEPATKTQVGFVAGYRVGRRVGGTFGNVLGQLRSAGLLDYPAAGFVALTDAGARRANLSDLERSDRGFQNAVRDRLNGPERRVLDVLIEAHPRDLAKADVGERAGYTVGPRVGGTFGNVLGRLRTLGLAGYPSPGRVVAADLLFPERVS